MEICEPPTLHSLLLNVEFISFIPVLPNNMRIYFSALVKYSYVKVHFRGFHLAFPTTRALASQEFCQFPCVSVLIIYLETGE